MKELMWFLRDRFESLSSLRAGSAIWNAPVCTLKFNWASLLAFVTFWSYGYYGAVAHRGMSIAGLALTVFLLAIYLLFLFLGEYRKEDFKDSVVLRKSDLGVIAIFLAAVLPFSVRDLSHSLVGDQLAHAQSSQVHFISLIQAIAGRIESIRNFPFGNLLWALDFVALAAGILLLRCMKGRSFPVRAAVYSLGFLSLRLAVFLASGGGSSHPQFRLFPLWLTSALLSPCDWGFRIAQFLPLIGLMWATQRMAVAILPFGFSCLLGLVVGTIPVLWHVGTLVEASIWTAVVWTTLLLSIARHDPANPFPHIRWISCVCIATMMRQTAFLALIPLFVMLGEEMIRKRSADIGKLLLCLAPLLVMAPFLMRSLLLGTPAIQYEGEASNTLGNILYAVRSGIALTAVLNSVLIPWAILLPISFLAISVRKPLYGGACLAWFLAAFVVFYSIRFTLWGIGRYQAEYVVPFSVVGLFLVVAAVHRLDRGRKYVIVLLLFLFAFNVVSYIRLPRVNLPADFLRNNFFHVMKERGYYSILSEWPFPNGRALRVAKQEGLAGAVYMAGITYGVFGEVLNGYTVNEVLAAKDRFLKMEALKRIRGISWTEPPAVEDIDSDPDIRLVLVSDCEAAESFVEQLTGHGWKRWREFRDDQYGATIRGFLRDEQGRRS